MMRHSIFLLLLICGFATAQPVLNPINTNNITIARDNWGVPHIFGKTDAEVAYGLAWANAEDNFSTMQELYMIGKGLSGRYKGADGALYDYAIRAFRIKELVDEKFENDLSAEFKKYLDGYIQGINAYAETHQKEVLLKAIFPLTAKEIIQAYCVALLQEQGIEGPVGRILANKNMLAEWNTPLGGGSNGVALSKKITKENKTFLLINPHQPLTGVGSNYEVHLHSEEGLNIHGALWHGALNPATFANENLASMTTTNLLDFVDVFQLQMNPENEAEYRFDGEWIKLEKNTVTLKVKLKAGISVPIRKKVYWSKYGATFKNKSGYFSVRAGAALKITAAEQLYQMNKSTSIEQFKKHASYFPMENFIYADKNDNIYLVNNGLVPKRAAGYDWANTVPGNSSATLWHEFYSIDELPHYTNPKGGYLYNVNNTVFDATDAAENLNPSDYPFYLNDRSKQNNRALRFKELMNATLPTMSYEDFKRIKYDVTLPQKSESLFFLEQLQQLDTAAYPQYAVYINQLRSWNRTFDTTSEAASTMLLYTYYLYSKKGFANFFNRIELNQNDLLEGLRFVNEYVNSKFKKSTITLGELQRFERGNVSFPLGNYPDVLACMFAVPDEKGIFNNIVRGDGFIMFVQFSDIGVEIETSNAYGSSSHADNAHYSDQMKLYLDRGLKKMTLITEEVMKAAVKTYQPGK